MTILVQEERDAFLSMFGARVSAVALATSLACFAQAGKTLAQAQKTPIQITADLSDAPRKLYHAEVDLPVSAGPLTLTTPQWIPGTHMPQGRPRTLPAWSLPPTASR